MAGGISNYHEPKILDLVYGQTALTVAATHYIALYTVVPTAANASGTEVTGGSYARIAVTNNTTTWAAATGSSPASKANAIVITFAAPTANWGVVVGFAVYDALTVGNELAWGPLAANKTINNGDPAPSCAIGSLVITLT